MKRYAERDIEALGQHYANHVDAMTREGLHDKTAIAAELAFRDALLEQCEAALDDSFAALQMSRGKSHSTAEKARLNILRKELLHDRLPATLAALRAAKRGG